MKFNTYQKAKRIGDDQKINVYPFNVFETNYRHECDVRYFKNHKTKGTEILLSLSLIFYVISAPN